MSFFKEFINYSEEEKRPWKSGNTGREYSGRSHHFHGVVPSFASNASSGSLPIPEKPACARQRGVVNVVHIHPLPQADRT